VMAVQKVASRSQGKLWQGLGHAQSATSSVLE
jgi:hypothetical protein